MTRLLLLLAASSLSYTGLDLITSMMLSRSLGPASIGDLTFLTNFAAFFSVLGTFGFVQANVMHFSQGGSWQSSFQAAKKMLAFSLILLSVVFWLGLYYLPSDYYENKNTEFGDLLLAFTYSVFHVTLVVLSGYLLASKQNFKFAISNVIYSSILLIFVSFLFLESEEFLTLRSTLIIYVFGKLCSILYVIYSIAKGREAAILKTEVNVFNYQCARRFYYYNLIQQCVGFAPIAIFAFYLKNSEMLGYFSRAMSISLLVTLIPLSLGPHIFSRWAHSLSEQKTQLPKIVAIYMAVSLIFLPPVVYFSEEIVSIIYGESFRAAGFYLNVIVFSAFFRIMYDPFLNALSAENMLETNTLIMLVSFFVFVFFALYLSDLYAGIGVVYASLLSNFLVFLMCVIAYVKHRRLVEDER
ncbi:hypothetical protein [Rheinheimera sp.]|uniref:hypothetical protein n=1 Tax=Rheinheimera sp. TaxID=1869214 RepID=UPI003D2CFB85